MTDRMDPPPQSPARHQPGWQETQWGVGRNAAGPAPAQRAEPPRDESALTRFMGGSPVAVLLRLLVVSLAVGALLMWLDIHPVDILRGVERFFRRVWYMGFDAVREIATYVIAGAVIVVPIWLLMRLFATKPGR